MYKDVQIVRAVGTDCPALQDRSNIYLNWKLLTHPSKDLYTSHLRSPERFYEEVFIAIRLVA
jgi:hypothetical protein